MRIIAGKHRNRNLKAGSHFRPTTDRVRETLFNIIQMDIPGSIMIDAFAGSGSVGIEALSRGAGMVYFLETNRRTLSIMESNLTACCSEDKWRIFSLPATKGMEVAKEAANGKIDILFFDPPYDFAEYFEILQKASELFPEALIILESSTRANLPEIQDLVLEKQRDIGETRLSFFRVKKSE